MSGFSSRFNRAVFWFVMALAGVSGSARAQHHPTAPVSKRAKAPICVVILAPDAGFHQLAAAATPALDRLAASGADGMMNIRTVHAGSVDEACLSIGAGSRANVSFPGEIGQSVERAEPFEGATGAQVYRRRTALNPQQFRLFAVNYAQIRADSAVVAYDLRPGLLGDTLRSAGICPAAIGSGDEPLGTRSGEAVMHREVVGVAMDHLGRVLDGEISGRIQIHDPRSPFSIHLDISRVLSDFTRLAPRCRFIAVEDGDLIALQETAALYTAAAFHRQQAVAVARLDQLVEGIADQLNLNRDLLIVCAPSLEGPAGGVPMLAPIVAAGPGIHGGWLSAGSTRRAGLVVLTDLAPTVLQFFHLPAPPAMMGSPIQSVPANRRWGCGPLWSLDRSSPLRSVGALADRVARLDTQRDSVERWFVYLCQLLLILTAPAVLWPHWRPFQITRLAEWGFLVPIAFPLAALIEAFLPHPSSLAAAVEILLLMGLVVLAAMAAGRPVGHSCLASVGMVAWLSCAAIVLDLLTGQQGLITSMVSYSPSEGARYYGIGNEYMGVLVGASVTALCLASSGPAWRKLAAIPLLFLPAVLICLPSIGAKAGGALVAVPTAALAAWLLLGRRFSLRLLLALGLSGAAVIALVAVRDLHNGAGMTHVGKAMGDVMTGGPTAAMQIIARKSLMEWRLLKYSPWSRCLLAAIFAAIMLYFFRRPAWKKMLAETSMRAAMGALIAAAVTGLLFNDAGVLAAALSFVYVPALMGGWLLSHDQAGALHPTTLPLGAADPPRDNTDPLKHSADNGSPVPAG